MQGEGAPRLAPRFPIAVYTVNVVDSTRGSVMKNGFLFVLLLALCACGTTDSQLESEGRSPAYLQGFHDGRHSGMKEAGNTWEHYIRDHARFEAEADYKAGWLAGEAEGKRLQAQATAVGEAAAGTYSGYRIGKEADKAGVDPDKIGRDVMKDVDTDELKALEK